MRDTDYTSKLSSILNLIQNRLNEMIYLTGGQSSQSLWRIGSAFLTFVCGNRPLRLEWNLLRSFFLFVLIFFFQLMNYAQRSNFGIIDSIEESTSLIVPEGDLNVDVLFIGGYHHVMTKNGSCLAKQDHDFTGYVGIEGRSDSGYVIVNHERVVSDPILGDGGGMTVFTVYKNPTTKKWSVVDAPDGRFRNVDFSEVGGTISNCGGFQTAYGTVLTAEEKFFYNNKQLHLAGSGIRDTSDFVVEVFNGDTINRTIKRYQNFDWMVEVDVTNAEALKKRYNMGRCSHEGGVVLPDRKTVFLTDDLCPGFIFKFVADEKDDFSKGQLFVYQQGEKGVGGRWLAIPMTLDNMINVRTISAELGATMFIRTEWMIYHDGKVFITETGIDDSKDEMRKYAKQGARFSRHLAELDSLDALGEDSLMNDYFGRILTLDVNTGQLEVFLEGGGDLGQHMAQPDCISYTKIDGHPYMLIHEDLNGLSHGRVPPGYNQAVNEIYWLDLKIKNPTVKDLKRFAVGPVGCETTGGRFTPDGKSYFFNIQHPNGTNEFPFNNSCTVAITGYAKEKKIDVATIDEELQPTEEIIFVEETLVELEEEQSPYESQFSSDLVRLNPSDLLNLEGRVLKVMNKNGRRIFKCKIKRVKRKVGFLLHGEYLYSIDGGEEVGFVFVREKL